MSEWIKWSGGKNPFSVNSVVEYVQMDGFKGEAESSDIDWLHTISGSDIAMYRTLDFDGSITSDESPTPAHYSKGTITQEMVGQKLDPALIAEVYDLTPMRFTVLKKVLRCGDGNKTYVEDLNDIISAANRELELVDLRGKS